MSNKQVETVDSHSVVEEKLYFEDEKYSSHIPKMPVDILKFKKYKPKKMFTDLSSKISKSISKSKEIVNNFFESL